MVFATHVIKQKGENALITGTGTAGQAGSSSVAYVPSLWTFNLGMTPSEGDMITIKVPVAGVNSGIWLSVDNGTTYYPVASSGTARLTTQFAAGQTLMLVYQKNMTTKILGTSIEGAPAGASTADYVSDRWLVLNYYDSNTTYTNASLGQGYGTCTTEEATTAKVVSLSSYSLTTGGIVAVKFTYAVPANATMNINSRGAKNLYYNGAAIKAGIIDAGDIAVFIYSSQYHLIGIHRTATGNANLGQGYGTCGTAESTAEKAVTLTNYTQTLGGIVSVKFTYAVPASAKLKINSKTAKNIRVSGANITAGVILAGDTATFIYDGSYYHLISIDRMQKMNEMLDVFYPVGSIYTSTNSTAPTFGGTWTEIKITATLEQLAEGERGFISGESASALHYWRRTA